MRERKKMHRKNDITCEMIMQKEQRQSVCRDDNERANDDEMKPNKQHKNYKLSRTDVRFYSKNPNHHI